MEQDCLCPLGDPNHCSSCNELQAEFDNYCSEMYASYLWNKEQELIETHIDNQGAEQ
jgi:hypothetical protein